VTIDTYAIAGQAVESELALPELPLCLEQRSGPVLRIRRGGILPSPTRVVDEKRLDDGRLWLAVFGAPKGLIFHFPELAQFAVSPDGLEVEYFMEPGVPEDSLRHLLLDQVLPYLAPFWGGRVFHASGVEISGSAIGFLGESGRGKSTLAAAFARRGFRVLSDDCLHLSSAGGGYRVRPWASGIRLWQDSIQALWEAEVPSTAVAHYTRKQRVAALAPAAGKEFPLGGIYLLQPPRDETAIRIDPMPPREACIELTRHAFLLDPSDAKRLRELFEDVGEMAESCPIYVLSYPRRADALSAVVESVLTHAAGRETSKFATVLIAGR
jgi:hypothetical protein